MNAAVEQSNKLANTKLAKAGVSSPSNLRPPARAIFQETWWLDAASDGAWQETQVVWDRQMVGVLPYMRFRKYGITRIAMPPYTRLLGPLLALPDAKPVKKVAQLRSVIGELLGQLPDHDWFFQTLLPECADAIGFALSGWNVEQSFTFRSPAEVSLDQAMAAMDGKTRNQVRQAEQRLKVECHDDIDRLLSMLRRQFEEHGTRNRHDYAALARILTAGLARRQAAILSAAAEDGHDAATVALIWDETTLYFWVSGRDREKSGGSALSLLVWQAVRMAKQRGLTMDFDGFATPAGGCFVANFGGVPAVRPLVSRRSARCAALHLIRDWPALIRRR